MRVGLQFVRQSARLKGVLLRVAIFFFHSTALLALLPLVARGLHSGDAATFTLLLASMGAGAIVAVMFLPRLRRAFARDTLVVCGSLLQAVTMASVALSADVALSALAMFLSGMGWITTANSLSVSAQLALPDWVRARGMSMYQKALMGASALGAVLWGQVATLADVQASLVIAATSGILAMLGTHFLAKDHSVEEDLTPSHAFTAPLPPAPSAAGRGLVTIEYRIDPSRADEFRALMREIRRRRLSHGALIGSCCATSRIQAVLPNKSSMNRGPSTCAISTAPPRPMSPCASASGRFTSAQTRRWCSAAWWSQYDADISPFPRPIACYRHYVIVKICLAPPFFSLRLPQSDMHAACHG
jgi:hypothetical protein